MLWERCLTADAAGRLFYWLMALENITGTHYWALDTWGGNSEAQSLTHTHARTHKGTALKHTACIHC